MKSLSPIQKAALIFILFIVPVSVYFLLRTGTNVYKPLPFYGIPEVSESGDTIQHAIGDFTLLTQNGDSLKRKDLDSNIYVVEFFFVNCPNICPKLTTNLARVNKKFNTLEDFKTVSITVNPERDSVSALKAYEKQYADSLQSWYFLTGDKKEIYQLARTSFMVNAMQGDGGPDDFIHTELLTLVDKNHHIRGYYDGTNKASVDSLIDDIKALRKENFRK
jgi:protein SCO1